MSFIRSRCHTLFMALAVGLLFAVFALPAQANNVTLTADGARYMGLKATVAFLEAYITALENGDASAAPSYTVLLSGDTVTIRGVVMRDPDPTRMEVCGPMEKGTVDWGDGTGASLEGLGCSGDTHVFTLQHQYNESGSFRITIEDNQGREKVHVLGVIKR